MNILVLVNQVQELKVTQSSCEIAFGLAKRGHNLHIGDVLGLSWDKSDSPSVKSHSKSIYKSQSIQEWLSSVQNAERSALSLIEFDLIWVRTNPGRDKDRIWGHDVVLDLLDWAERQGVTVLNPPSMLRKASSKMYLQDFSAKIRPRAVISQDSKQILEFIEQENRPVILKPLRGTGGSGVFIVRPNDLSNVNQIIEIISRQDFIIAQEYLEAGVIGDTRLLLLYGEPIRVNGEVALVTRLRQGYDLRSNVAVGGKPSRGVYSDEMKEVVRLVSAKLKSDNIFLAGLDIIGDKVVEINVYSPGGIQDASFFAKQDFLAPILDAAEKEVEKKLL